MNKMLSIGGGLLIAIFPFLPAITMMGETMSFWAAREKSVSGFFITIGVVGMIVGFLDKRWLNILNLITGLLCSAISFKYVADARTEVTSAGIGLWLFMIGSLVMTVGAIMGMAKKKSTLAVAA